MSMAMALEYVTEFLIERNGWTKNQVGVQPESVPPYDAGPWYIALDDSGVETGNDETDSLKEILTLTIGIWRRPEHLQNDRKGMLKLPQDKYIIGAWTLHALERATVVHKSAIPVKNGLHNNWSLVSGINTRYNLPSEEGGANFTQPLRYKGRGRMETVGYADEQNVHTFYGYRLRFSGLHREQKMRNETDAIG